MPGVDRVKSSMKRRCRLSKMESCVLFFKAVFKIGVANTGFSPESPFRHIGKISAVICVAAADDGGAHTVE